MTHKEVTAKIQNVESKNWFQEVKADFVFSHLAINVTKEGFTDIYQYVSRQVRGWNKMTVDLPQEFKSSEILLQRLLTTLDDFLEQSSSYSVSQLNSQWNSITNNYIRPLNQNEVFLTDAPITSFLINLYKEYGVNFYQGAYNYLIKPSGNASFSTPEVLTGAFMAYEFKFQESTKIVKRRRQEKSSTSRLRNDFEKYFTETSKHLNEHIDLTNQKVKENSDLFDEFLEEKRKTFDEWYSQTQSSFHAFNSRSLETMRDNEELYKEKLKLEAPAAYWRERAESLKKAGNNWLLGLLISAGISVGALGIVLFLISDGTLTDLFSNTGTAIKWSIVFITFVSFLAFSVRIFSKLTFSSFHLVRDAEEREQLAYVYLALKKEKNIDETERHLVMQSIFSRADSGLLKDDNSPTMPGNIVDKFMAKS